MRAGPIIIGLDVGTTATKAVAFELGGGGEPMRAERGYPLLTPEPAMAVQDPAAILAAAADALAEVAAQTGGRDVVAVSVSTAMHGLLGLDADKLPVTPVITWADSRAATEAAALRASAAGARLQKVIGTPLHPMTPLTKLMWLTGHDPETASAARWWVGLKDYVLWWLTGIIVTELSSASGTGLLDITTGAWDPEAIETAGITAEQLPAVRPTTATLPLVASTARQVGLAAGTPIVLGAGDGPLANLGTGALDPGIAALSLGTSAAVRMVVPAAMPDPDGRLFCYALADGAWVIGGPVSNGSVVLRWVSQVIANGDDSQAALLARATSAPPGSAGLVMLPYLLAERAPLWDPSIAGAYLGLRFHHTGAHMARAALEGVCLHIATVVDQVNERHPVSAVRATGGAFRSPLWREVMTATLGRPVSFLEEADGTAAGAAALGLVAIGRAADLRDGLRQVAPGAVDAGPPVAADPALVAVYDAVAAGVADLIAASTPMASLWQAASARLQTSRRQTGVGT